MLPELQAEVRQWLYRARLDEEAADQLLAGPRGLPEVAVYHCQQPAEKALKSYLVYEGRPTGPLSW